MSCLIKEVAIRVNEGVSYVIGLRVQHNRYPRPRFLPGETNFTYTRGDTATLLCSIADLGTKTVTWRRASTLNPLTIGKMTFTEEKEYEVHRNSLNWNLLIKNVQQKHSGSYECQISTKDKMKRTVYLTVLDEERFREPDISISGLLHIDKGQTIQLRCNATGVENPPDAIDWFKDGTKVQTNTNKKIEITEKFSMTAKTITSELRIEHSQMNDTGTYTCRTSDQVTSKNVNILNAKPKPKPKTKPKRDEEKLKLPIVEKPGGSHSNGNGRFRNGELMMVMVTLVLISSLLISAAGTR